MVWILILPPPHKLCLFAGWRPGGWGCSYSVFTLSIPLLRFGPFGGVREGVGEYLIITAH